MTKIVATTLTCLLSFAMISRAADLPASTETPAPTTKAVPISATVPPPAPAAEEPAKPLEVAMKKIAKAYKALKVDLQQPADANKKDYLDLVATIKTELQTSRGFAPNKSDGLPDDQKATMVAAYQKAIDEMIKSVDTLADAISNSKWDAANSQIDVILQQEKEGHKEFRKKTD